MPAPRHRALSQLRPRGTAELGSPPPPPKMPDSHHQDDMTGPLFDLFATGILTGVDPTCIHLEFRTFNYFLNVRIPPALFVTPSSKKLSLSVHVLGFMVKVPQPSSACVMCSAITLQTVKSESKIVHCLFTRCCQLKSICFNLDHLQEGSV